MSFFGKLRQLRFGHDDAFFYVDVFTCAAAAKNAAELLSDVEVKIRGIEIVKAHFETLF